MITKEGDLEQENKQLKYRIAELEDKDWYEKCIKQLEEQVQRLIDEKYAILAQIEQQIRKQVCDEIRAKIKELIDNKDHCLTNWEYSNGWCSGLQYDMARIINQIEKGE